MSKIISQLLPLAISIDKIRSITRNARLHPHENLAALKVSLETYGQRKPIVVNNRTGYIEAGNGLFIAAKALGWQEIAAIYVNDDNETASAFGLMDNQSALLADWDLPNLREIITELNSKDLDLFSTGFSDDEINALLSPESLEHNMSSQISKGYVEGIENIDPLKLAFRLESVCHCEQRKLAIDLFSGQGRLSFWYQRLFNKTIRVDRQSYDGIDFNQKASIFLEKHLKDFMDFNFIDFDDEGCPGRELQLFFSLIEGKQSPFILCLTDGLGLALKIRVKINLYDKYLYGRNNIQKIKNNSGYENFDRYVKHLIDTLCYKYGFYNRVLNWYRGAQGNVIYAGFEITPQRHINL